MTYQFIEEGAFIYGITRSKSDIKKFKHSKNIKTFHGDVRNTNLIKQILVFSSKIKD